MNGNATQITNASPSNIGLHAFAGLAGDATLNARCRSRRVIRPQTIQGEANSVPFHTQRWVWQKAIESPGAYAVRFARLCLIAQLQAVGFVTLGTQANDGSWPIDLSKIADSLIQTTVSAMVNLVAVTVPGAAA